MITDLNAQGQEAQQDLDIKICVRTVHNLDIICMCCGACALLYLVGDPADYWQARQAKVVHCFRTSWQTLLPRFTGATGGIDVQIGNSDDGCCLHVVMQRAWHAHALWVGRHRAALAMSIPCQHVSSHTANVVTWRGLMRHQRAWLPSACDCACGCMGLMAAPLQAIPSP